MMIGKLRVLILLTAICYGSNKAKGKQKQIQSSYSSSSNEDEFAGHGYSSDEDNFQFDGLYKALLKPSTGEADNEGASTRQSNRIEWNPRYLHHNTNEPNSLDEYPFILPSSPGPSSVSKYSDDENENIIITRPPFDKFRSDSLVTQIKSGKISPPVSPLPTPSRHFRESRREPFNKRDDSGDKEELQYYNLQRSRSRGPERPTLADFRKNSFNQVKKSLRKYLPQTPPLHQVPLPSARTLLLAEDLRAKANSKKAVEVLLSPNLIHEPKVSTSTFLRTPINVFGKELIVKSPKSISPVLLSVPKETIECKRCRERFDKVSELYFHVKKVHV